MMKALILNNMVVDVSTQEFPVASSFTWMDCPVECQAGWKLFNGEIVEFTSDELAEQQAQETKAITKHISAYRRAKENGGITLSGVTVQTDTESRANLIGAKDLGTSIDWKTDNGFVTLTAQQISDIATAVGTHVQKCFSAEKEVTEAHDNNPFTSIEAVETAFDNAYNS